MIAWVVSLVIFFTFADSIVPQHFAGQRHIPGWLKAIEQFLEETHLGFAAFVMIVLTGVFAIFIGPIGLIVIGVRALIHRIGHRTRKSESTTE